MCQCRGRCRISNTTHFRFDSTSNWPFGATGRLQRCEVSHNRGCELSKRWPSSARHNLQRQKFQDVLSPKYRSYLLTQLCLRANQSNSDWLLTAQSKSPQADSITLDNNEYTTVNIAMPRCVNNSSQRFSAVWWDKIPNHIPTLTHMDTICGQRVLNGNLIWIIVQNQKTNSSKNLEICLLWSNTWMPSSLHKPRGKPRSKV